MQEHASCKSKSMRLESSDRWYEHIPAEVMENDEVEFYWDLTADRHDSVKQQARYYLNSEGNKEMDNH